MELAGRVAVIVGGSRGLGLEIARQLVDRDVRLAICARDEAELASARQDLERRLPVDLHVGACDNTDPQQVAGFIEDVRRRLGPVDLLLNVAGIITVGPFDTLGREAFEESFATHVSGPLEFIRAVLPDMRRSSAGRIVNIGSIGGKVPVPHLAAYVASKHALVGLSETLRAELASENIYVTTVNPGLMRTGSPWHARFMGDPQAEFAWFGALDNLPGLSISPRIMARGIIDAMEHGDAELTSPWTARAAASFHGLFGGLGTELAALQARLLPQGTRVSEGEAPVKGWDADVGQMPGALRRRQAGSAARYNEA